MGPVWARAVSLRAGSQNQADYPTDNLRRAREGQSECLLYAEDATNIRCEGLGVIDGRGTPVPSSFAWAIEAVPSAKDEEVPRSAH